MFCVFSSLPLYLHILHALSFSLSFMSSSFFGRGDWTTHVYEHLVDHNNCTSIHSLTGQEMIMSKPLSRQPSGNFTCALPLPFAVPKEYAFSRVVWGLIPYFCEWQYSHSPTLLKEDISVHLWSPLEIVGRVCIPEKGEQTLFHHSFCRCITSVHGSLIPNYTCAMWFVVGACIPLLYRAHDFSFKHTGFLLSLLAIKLYLFYIVLLHYSWLSPRLICPFFSLPDPHFHFHLLHTPL